MAKTAKIAFIPNPELGHLYPTLRLARDLAARGHDVVYHAPPAFFDLIGGHGLPVLPLWGAWFDRDFERIRGVGPEDERWRARQRVARRETQMAINGDLQRAIERGSYDLLVADTITPSVAVIGWKLGIPCVQYATQFPIDAAVPGPEYEARVQRSIDRQREAERQVDLDFPDLATHIPSLISRYGYKQEWLARDDWCPGVRCHTARAPILLIPPALAVDPSLRRRYDFGQSLPRPEDEPGVAPRADARRVCLSFGSNAAHYPAGERVARAVLATFADLPAFSLLAIGLPGSFAGPFADCANIEFPGFISQRDLLRDGVRLMISHGGMGAFKECAYFATPLLVIPFAFDQPLNATFATALGIGRDLSPDASPEQIRAAIHAALADGDCRARAAELCAQVRRFERRDSGADLVEHALVSPERPRGI